MSSSGLMVFVLQVGVSHKAAVRLKNPQNQLKFSLKINRKEKVSMLKRKRRKGGKEEDKQKESNDETCC